MKTILFSIFFLVAGQSMAHKYYVSICDLAYNEEKGTIEGYIKLTAHDLEKILQSEFPQKVVLEEVSDSSDIGIVMQNYLHENVALYSNGKKATLSYIGKEVTLRDELYIYISFSNISDPGSIELYSNLLYEYFKSQQNIVHYKYKDLTKSVTLTLAKKRDKIKFD
jgi:hypothetical protein